MQPALARQQPDGLGSLKLDAGRLSLRDTSRAKVDQAIEEFLRTARDPLFIDPGKPPIRIAAGENFVLRPEARNALCACWLCECWDDQSYVTRRLTRVLRSNTAKLEIETKHFGGRSGRVIFLDGGRSATGCAPKLSRRLTNRESFRRVLARQFPDWAIEEISTDPDLEHTLSPVYPRAVLRRGRRMMAALGAMDQDAAAPEDAVSFGLVWLDYVQRRGLRQRQSRSARLDGTPEIVHELALFVPAGRESAVSHRVRMLDSNSLRVSIFVHDSGKNGSGWEHQIDPADYSNLETRVDPRRVRLAGASTQVAEWADRLRDKGFIEERVHPDGTVSFAVNGFEFAEASAAGIRFGSGRGRIITSEKGWQRAYALAEEIWRFRNPEPVDPSHALYRLRPEAWLESRVRAEIETIDASLRPSPVYGQVPATGGTERGIIDLLAIDRFGRLAVIELKARADISFPLQALDYWTRVRWHQRQGDFTGYFPGIPLSSEPPRLILIAPALDWHPVNETILRYFSPEIPVERVGVGMDWRRKLQVLFHVI